MSLCPHALYMHLVSDLCKHLPTYAYADLLSGGRSKARPGADAKEFACLSLLDSILKKFKDEKSKDADSKALAKFLNANDHCGRSVPIDTEAMTEIQAIALGEFRSAFHDFWLSEDPAKYWLETVDVLNGIDTGPGSSRGVDGQSFYEKLAVGRLTGDKISLFRLYKRMTSMYPLEDETEKIRSNLSGDFTEVLGSKLSFVPKSRDISRTICTEPLLNMLIQKGLSGLFESRLLRRFGINLSTQPEKNQILAKLGSSTGQFGTIDLQSASDTISLSLMRELLPGYVFAWLKEARTGFTELPDGSQVELRMVSSMGNAFTFPLQTILFACVVVAVYKTLGLKIVYPKGDNLGNFAVFGDDIIVRREAYDLVCNLLGRLGFWVNHDKSFNDGPFRESCGADFWHGENVRGIYCTSLATKQDVLSLVNRLNVWSANHRVALPNTCKYLLSDGIQKYWTPVPYWESDVAGIRVPWALADYPRLKRSKETGSVMYLRYLPSADSTSLVDIESRPPKRLRLNGPGVLLASLAGKLRDGKILKRQNLPYYKKRIAVAPGWDYFAPCRGLFDRGGWHRWLNTYVEANIGECLPPQCLLE